MPVSVQAEIQLPTVQEFKQIVFEVVSCAFEVHNEIGRFCEERIYKRLVAKRISGVALEVPVTVSFEDFRKQYFLVQQA